MLPAALPQIMTGLRVSMGTALSILVASELLGGDRGLGFVVLDASNFFRTTYVFAGIILIGLIGLLSDRGLALLTRKVVHWEGRRSVFGLRGLSPGAGASSEVDAFDDEPARADIDHVARAQGG